MSKPRVRPKRGKVYSGTGRVEPATPTAARIQQRLKALNWTNAELAKRLDVHKQQVSRWTTGTSATPSPIYLAKLARALGVTSDWILNGDAIIEQEVERDLDALDAKERAR